MVTYKREATFWSIYNVASDRHNITSVQDNGALLLKFCATMSALIINIAGYVYSHHIQSSQAPHVQHKLLIDVLFTVD
jgi:hypothetical protein